jgi:hypothetical protein
MGKLSLNKLRQGFGELGHSTLYQCYFDDSSLNTIGGEYCPAILLDYDALTIKGVEVDYGMDVKITYPVYASPTLKIDITFLDTDLKSLRIAVETWTEPLTSGRVPDLSKYSKKLTIEDYDVTGNLVRKKTYTVYPIGELPFKGDQEAQPDSNVLHLQVISSN